MKLTSLVALVGAFASPVSAQYPRVPKPAQEEADARRAAADKRSDEAFARAQPLIREWAVQGKPYLPGAAEPKELPQARIPATRPTPPPTRTATATPMRRSF